MLSTAEESTQNARLKYDCEAYKEVAMLLSELVSDGNPEAILLHLYCRRELREEIDLLMLEAKQYVNQWEKPSDKAQLQTFLAYGYMDKRISLLAIKAAEEAIQLDPSQSRSHVALGMAYLKFDYRDKAEVHFQQAIIQDEPQRGYYALAYLCFVRGDFDRALQLLDQSKEGVKTNRLRLRIARTLSEYKREVQLLEMILHSTPSGAWRRYDQYDKAIAQYLINAVELAVEGWKDLWRENSGDWVGHASRHTLDAHDKSNGEGERIQLQSFPTVQQRDNYCGPACLELVLRHFNKNISQDEIAKEVFNKNGTPVHSMTHYLEKNGFEVRRIEASPDRIKACLKCGIPIIMEEEYAMSTHVSVIIGFDERLQLIIMQDPMSHSAIVKLWDDQRNLGLSMRNAAIVAIPADASTLLKQLDDADVLDQPYLHSFDKACAPYEQRNLVMEITYCEDAIHIQPDFPAAHRRRLFILLEKFEMSNSDKDEAIFLKELCETRLQHPHWNFFQEIYARYLFYGKRDWEAIMEYEEAASINPRDANLFERQGVCWMGTNKEKAAVAFLKALSLSPSHVFATKHLAAVKLELGDYPLVKHLVECACAMEPENPYNYRLGYSLYHKLNDEVNRLYWAKLTAEKNPDNYEDQINLAKAFLQARHLQDSYLQQGINEFEKAIARWPESQRTFTQAVLALEELDQLDRISELINHATSTIADSQVGNFIYFVISFWLRQGRSSQAYIFLENVIQQRGNYQLYWTYLDQLNRLKKTQRAIDWLKGRSPDEDHYVYQLPVRLARVGSEYHTKIEEGFKKALSIWPASSYLICGYAGYQAVQDPKKALAFLNDQKNSDTDLLFNKAKLMLQVKDYEGAFDIIENMANEEESLGSQWQHLFNQTLLKKEGSITSALDFLYSFKRPTTYQYRAMFTLEVLAGNVDEALQAAHNIPEDDEPMKIFVRLAAQENNVYRNELHKRLSVATKESDLHTYRYDQAVLAASEAVLGNEEGYNKLLVTEQEPEILDEATVAFHDINHWELSSKSLEVLAKHHDGGLISQLSRVMLASCNNRHNEAESIIIDILKTTPDSAPALRMMTRLKILNMQLAEAKVWCDRTFYAESGFPWVDEQCVRAILSMFDGNWEHAKDWFDLAILQLNGDGNTSSMFPLVQAVEEILSGNQHMIGVIRKRHSVHLYSPHAPLWDALQLLSAPKRV